jgi:hypothetical protein
MPDTLVKTVCCTPAQQTSANAWLLKLKSGETVGHRAVSFYQRGYKPYKVTESLMLIERLIMYREFS